MIKKKMLSLYRSKTLLLMLLPAVVLVFIFAYLPMGGIILAFKQYRIQEGFWGSQWVGFSNFKFFFMSGQALQVTMNTVLYNITFVVVNTSLQILFAVVLSEVTSKAFKKVTQSMMLLPHFMSWVIVASIAYNIFNYENGHSGQDTGDCDVPYPLKYIGSINFSSLI